MYGTTTVGIGVGAIVGSLAAEHLASAILVAAAAGLLLGVAASYGASIGWIALQGGIAVMIAMSYPATVEGALRRAALVVGGALAQTAVLTAARSVRHCPAGPAPVAEFVPHYALHLVVALAAGVALERLLALRNGYWVPMTTLLVLRPATEHTMTRAFARTVGTLAGCAVASLVAMLHPPVPVVVEEPGRRLILPRRSRTATARRSHEDSSKRRAAGRPSGPSSSHCTPTAAAP